MSKRVNYMVNPNGVGSTVGWSRSNGTGGASTIAPAADSTAPTGAGSAMLVTWTTAPTSGGYVYASSGLGAVTPGLPYSVGVWVKPSRTMTMFAVVDILNSSGGAVGSKPGTATSCPANQWTWLPANNYIAPAAGTQLLTLVEWSGTFVNGDTVAFAGALGEQAVGVGSFFSGDTAPAYWQGTAEDSWSTMPVIDVVQDLVNLRTSLTLDGFQIADGPIGISRVHADGSTYAVRDTPYLSAGSAFTHDYELPFQEAVYYTAADTAGVVKSSSTTMAVDQFMLRAPGQPDYDVSLIVEGKPVLTRPKAQTVLRPIGRTNAVVLSGPRGGSEFTLQVRTTTSGEASALDGILAAASTCLLVMPGTRIPWLYVGVGDAVETPVAPWRSVVTGDAGDQSVWTLPCVEVDQPVGAVTADSSFNYGTVLTEYTTYAAVLSANATYLALEQGL